MRRHFSKKNSETLKRFLGAVVVNESQIIYINPEQTGRCNSNVHICHYSLFTQGTYVKDYLVKLKRTVQNFLKIRFPSFIVISSNVHVVIGLEGFD